MNISSDEPVWHRQFWPWFLIVLPGTAVVASFVTLYIAIVHSHSMVKDDYYKDGLAINKYLHEDQLARQLELSASVAFNENGRDVSLRLSSEVDQQNQVLILSFIDPVDSKSDFDLPLHKAADGSYQQSVLKLAKKRWYLQLSPADTSADQRWRIRGEIDLARKQHTTLTSSSLD